MSEIDRFHLPNSVKSESGTIKEHNVKKKRTTMASTVSSSILSKSKAPTNALLFASKLKRRQRIVALIKTIWVTAALWFVLLKGTLIFVGIEGTNERLQNYKNLVAQQEYNATRGATMTPDTFNTHYQTALAISQAKCELVSSQVTSWNNMGFGEKFQYAMSIATTVGWGTYVPRSALGKGVTMIYALIGIPLFAALIGQVARLLGKLEGRIIRSRVSLTNMCKTPEGKMLLKNRTLVEAVFGLFFAVVLVVLGAFYIRTEMNDTHTTKLDLHKNITIVGRETDWGVFPSIYYLFISVSTIGFGDMYLYQKIAETNRALRILKILLVFVIVVVYVAWFTRIISKLARAARERMREDIKTVFVTHNVREHTGNSSSL